MSAPLGPPGVTLLDACVVIDLYATRQMEPILRADPTAVSVVDLVRSESLYVRRGGSGEDAREREPVDLDPVLAAGVVRVVTPSDAELRSFVDLTLRLDDGEAMTAAVAIHRGWSPPTTARPSASWRIGSRSAPPWTSSRRGQRMGPSTRRPSAPR